ncbi:hypothetical protein M758_7G188000 [Ceratodon purpureus]|nr:hypothetical protein M758_7G188000 [Ceratodon purpureus]
MRRRSSASGHSRARDRQRQSERTSERACVSVCVKLSSSSSATTMAHWLRNLMHGLSMPRLHPHLHSLPPTPALQRCLTFCFSPVSRSPSPALASTTSNTAHHHHHHHDDDDDDAAAASRPRLLAPVRHLLSDAVQRGYAKYNSQGLARATSNPKFVAAPDAAIVLHYSAIIRSIVNYYSFVHSRSSLWKVTSIYRKSCALTLARKHSLRSAQAAFSKFGPKLRISTPDSKDDVVLFYPDSLKTTGKFNIHAPRYSQVAILQEPFEKKRWR